MLIDKKLMKKDLIEMAGITTNAMAKMGKGGDVSTQVLSKICNALDCKLEDIVELDSEQKSWLLYFRYVKMFYNEVIADVVQEL